MRKISDKKKDMETSRLRVYGIDGKKKENCAFFLKDIKC